ncbi:MAG: dihydroorotate dehydrogenase [Syntrophobacterales bacterium]|nr:dihydroorotate dehydrogenase [Syntrophobacterales bacterium]
MSATLPIDLSVNLGPIKLKNPVMVASGTFGYGREYADIVPLECLGAVVVKGISLKPRPGNPPPRLVETPAGLINAIGLENVGIETFLSDKLPFLRKRKIPTVVNIFGETVEEYGEIARRLDGVDGVVALEINISCPNVKAGGVHFGTNPSMASSLVKAVRAATSLPIITKLSPQVTSIADMAKAVEDAGTDIISCINTVPAMAVNIYSRKPLLGNVIGGLSGPAIKPIALRCVYEVVKSVGIPVIGIGGIANAEDALEFLLVGARAVQIGTMNFANPRVVIDVIEGIENFMRLQNISKIEDFIGTLKTL